MREMDPNELARLKFEGYDLDVINQLIENAEAELVSARNTVASYELYASENPDNYEPSSPHKDSSLRLKKEFVDDLKVLRSRVSSRQIELDGLLRRKEELIKEKNSPKNIQ